ncbi:MAG: four-carbon acid sugar kinase family protein [Betaproteobacteria bacterium]|nr:four-carbon acid sugar kinase family protein [Betaproteobacteria bacterium]MBA3775399.1 four-carbon acid sugar kinase family protein [Betaproteobacteria bacterium]
MAIKNDVLLGCIADDLTGATDLASVLVRNGCSTLLLNGVPPPSLVIPESGALIVALKSRTIAAGDAVAQSLAALRWLSKQGTRRFFFKYCSTFDSTPAGNIGPVADALLDALHADFTIACPAYPANGRSVYHGHLFVGDALLSETSMRHHPLTPMSDAYLVRVLGKQTPHAVGLISIATVEQGEAAIRDHYAKLARTGVRHAIVDAYADRHLHAIAAASADLPLVTGGAGVAMGFPDCWRASGLLREWHVPRPLPLNQGRAAILSGSCSAATLAQVERWQRDGHAAFPLDPVALVQSPMARCNAIAWVREQPRGAPVLVYASAPPEEVAQAQAKLGAGNAAAVIEEAFRNIAVALAEDGIERLIVAGGETAGAVVAALGVQSLAIGEEICPGVPWTLATCASGKHSLHLALKSGNFGGPDFFAQALAA